MGFIDNIKKTIRNFLKIQDNNSTMVNLIKNKTENVQLNAYKLWYQGDSDLLNQFYQNLANQELNFWGVVPSVGLEVPKKHSGIPKLMVDLFSNQITRDLNEITINDNTQNEVWSKVAEFNDFKNLTNEILKGSLSIGDGAIKIIQNSKFDEPILQFVDGCNVRYEREYGRIVEVIFFEEYTKDYKNYVFEEHYGYGYIKNMLFETNGMEDIEVPLSTLQETSKYENFIKLNNNMIYAVPTFLLGMDGEFKGRGKSLYSGKIDSFDGIDETISLLENAIRQGRVKTYIPESCIPRDPETGELLMFNNSFDNQFIKLDSNLSETGQNKVDVEQPTIDTEQFLKAYKMYLSLSCLGIVAPCSLGIEDDYVNANASASNEREKVTIITRNQIIESYTNVVKELVNKILIIKGYKNSKKDNISISFNAYQSPCFESRLDAMAKASQYGVLSAKTQIDELYGDDFSVEFKSIETVMLMIEKGTLNKYNFKVMVALKQLILNEETINKINEILEEQEQSQMEMNSFGDFQGGETGAKGPGQDQNRNNYKSFEKAASKKYF